MFSRGTRKLLNYSLISTIGISGFLGGIYYERRKSSLINNYKSFIFKSVFAATPLSPVPLKESASGNRVAQIMKHGFPSLDNIRSFDDYVLSYDRRSRVAHWVFEHLTPENTKYNSDVDRSKCDFKPDESIHPYFRYVVLLLVILILNINYVLGRKILIIKSLDMIEDI